MRDCKLIATIPAMTDLDKVRKIISSPYIYGVRWNTGIVSPYSVDVTLDILKEIAEEYKKILWVDIKGRQLRVDEWGNPLYSAIKLNHSVKVDGKARVKLRGEPLLELVGVNGREIFVNPLPRHAVGKGQSLNILGNVSIDGYLTDLDIQYLKCCYRMGIFNIMASFIEDRQDIQDILNIDNRFEIVCKIESEKGIKNVSDFYDCSLMAARDDLYIELQDYQKMEYSLQKIIMQDAKAICASRIFTSLEHSDMISYSDFEDLEHMYSLGYRYFMLCDNVSNYCFEQALNGWGRFIYV